MFEILGSFFTSIISGGATGLLGVALQRWADLQKYKLDIQMKEKIMANDLAMKEMDIKMMEMESAAKVKVAQVEEVGQEAMTANNAFAASFNEPQRYSSNVVPNNAQGWAFVLLDFIRGLVRPVLTVYLCLVTTLVYRHAVFFLDTTTGMTAEQALGLVKLIVSTVLYLTTTCVLWYFGTRNKQPPPKIQN